MPCQMDTSGLDMCQESRGRVHRLNEITGGLLTYIRHLSFAIDSTSVPKTCCVSWFCIILVSWIVYKLDIFNRKTKMINLIWLWNELIFDKNDDNAISTAITRITLIQFCWKLKSKCNQSFPKIHTLLLWFFTDGRFSTPPTKQCVQSICQKIGFSAKVGKQMYGLTQ